MRGLDARFPVEVRVRSGREYREAFADCRRVATRHFSLHLRSRDGGFCRLGMAVSRKVSPDAVVRNRIKRQIRESFRQRRHGLPAGDCIVVARAGAGALGKAALRAELETLWQPPARVAAIPARRHNRPGRDPGPRGPIVSAPRIPIQPRAPSGAGGRVTE
ncbi:MAG: ribonuclease P protein component [Silanimonas sp.]|nr:MAG: ribonuclease P protein component [Silanimonas sp.]